MIPRPTIDLYLGHLAQASGLEDELKPRGENIYAFGDALIVSRYLTAPDREQIDQAMNATRPPRLVYLVDDDIPALIRCPEQPADYKERLISQSRLINQDFLHSCEEILVSSSALAGLFSREYGVEPTVIHPHWGRFPSRAVTRSRLATMFQRKSVQLAFLGSRSHLSDLLPILPDVLAAMQDHRVIHGTTYLG
ncbi:MAG: hypothetical protein AAF357_18505, partial [Verrucomicrobiota bacterium]